MTDNVEITVEAGGTESAVTADEVAAGVDRKTGSRLDAFASFTKLGYGRAAFRDWAVELRTALETNP